MLQFNALDYAWIIAFTGAWCNGSTAVFGTVYPGSNPGAPACLKESLKITKKLSAIQSGFYSYQSWQKTKTLTQNKLERLVQKTVSSFGIGLNKRTFTIDELFNVKGEI